MARYFTLQNTTDTSITSGTVIGQLGFAASNDSDGGDAIVISSAVIASADGTFDATSNPGSLVFATSPTGPATGQMKVVDAGHLEPIGNKLKNLGSSSSQWKDLYVEQIYFDGLGPQTLPFSSFVVSATGDPVTVADGNTVTFTGQDSVTVSRDGQTIIISGAAGGGGGVTTGPAQSIAFYSGDGTLTGISNLTYNEALTSIKLTTQGTNTTTGFYIENAQAQDGNMFQVDTFVETIASETLTRDVTSSTGDGFISTSLAPPGFTNTSETFDFTLNATTNSTGMLPFEIPDFDADLAAEDIADGAKVTFFNSSIFQDDAISGYIAIYTGSADPVVPDNKSDFLTFAGQVGLQTTLNLVDGGGTTNNPSESEDFTPALQQYFGLHPSNTGNIVVFWFPTSAAGSPAQNQQHSADNLTGSGVSPRLNLTYPYYSGTSTFVEKTNYVVDAQGKLRLNTDDYANVGNANMIYVSGQDNLPCNMVLNSSNGQTKIVHWRGGRKLFTVGGNTPGTDWSIFDNVNAAKPIKIDNTELNYRDEQVVMRWKGGKVGIYDTSPDYDLDIHGDLGVRSGIFLYNGTSVGFDDTAHRLYRSGNSLMWNGSEVTGGGGGGGMTSWDLGVGSESTATIGDGDTVTFSGLNQITTTRSTNRIDIDVDLSNYYTISQVDTISGNLQTQIDANDNYQYWTVTDGVTSENIATTDTVKFTGGANVGVTYNSSNNTVTISSSAGGGGMTSWTIADGSGNSEAIGNADTLYISGAGSVVTDYDSATNIMTVSGTAGGGGTPGGSNTQIQFNDSSSFGGDADLTWNKTSNELTINGRLNYDSSYSTLANSGNIGSSMTFDLDDANIFSGTLTTTSITLSTTNGDVGQRFILRLKQGSGGSKTVGTWFGNRVMWPGGSAPTLSTTAGHVDLFGFLVTSGTAPTLYYDGFTIATGIQ